MLKTQNIRIKCKKCSFSDEGDKRFDTRLCSGSVSLKNMRIKPMSITDNAKAKSAGVV